jgi:hypothetical protein
MKGWAFVAVAVLVLWARAGRAAPVYVVLWFDTEDPLLPADDDATLRIARFLSGEKVRATFKVTGEKARVLEQRRRKDVIAALKRHEIGFHADLHSVHPTPAAYLSALGWDEGVAEFVRREGPGVASVRRAFGVAPTCYGQPGTSWGPQSHGALARLAMKVYLGAARHVELDGGPFYYEGVLTIGPLRHVLRTDLGVAGGLEAAKRELGAARDDLAGRDGGFIGVYYHPNELVAEEFWDAVNFRGGQNPPRDEWRPPPAKSAEDSRRAFESFESYVRFMKALPETKIVSAGEAAKLLRDRAQGRTFTASEVREIAAAVVKDGVGFQVRGDHALAASETLALLLQAWQRKPLVLRGTPVGPTEPPRPFPAPVTATASQLDRTIADVAAYLAHHGRVPSTVWLGSAPVSPEAFLVALAQAVLARADGRPPLATVELRPTPLTAARYVSDDERKLWGWVIFPPGFRAPEMLSLAKRQAWTLKPALLR